eukprot:m.114619 g.114619  ORF g.114619 m.114619 type:complete len:57 (-) comp22942_c0_seq1:31-201(-)
MRFSKMLSVVDAHAAGEPARVVTGGISNVPGKTMFDKAVYLEKHKVLVLATDPTTK